MASFAEPSDVAAAWRPLTAAEETVATTRLAEASNKLRVAVPTIDADIIGNPLKTELAKTAVVNAVIRVMSNPDALLSEKIDDYEFRRDSAVSAGLLYIDPRDLDGLVIVRRGKYRTIRLKAGLGIPGVRRR